MILSHKKCGFIGLLCNQKNLCLIGGGSCNFQPSFKDGSVSFVPKGGREGGMCFLCTTFTNAPTHPTLYVLTSR